MHIFKYCTITILSSSLLFGTAFSDEWGLIVKDHFDCENDHMAINTNSGWVLAEAYSTYSSLIEGAYIKGNLNS